MSVTCPIDIEELRKSTTAYEKTLSLPPAAFTDPNFHEFEMNAIWGHEWFCIGRATDIPKRGDYYSVIVGHEPLIAVRQKDGSVRVLSNVCRHRGQLLVEGKGNVRRITCPMHAWVYELDGGLVSAPGLNDNPTFDKSEVCLPEIRSLVWEGFIFITFDDEIPPIDERLAGLSEKLANYHVSEVRSHVPLELDEFDWNWKVFADECYHCTYLHANSWGKMYPVPSSAVDEESKYNDTDNGVFAYDLISRHRDAAPTRTGSALFPILPDLTDEERSRLSFITVAPNLLIVAMPDKVKYFLWLPLGATRSQFGVSWNYPQSTIDDPAFKVNWQMEHDDLHPVMIEDLNGWRRYQIGIQSRFAARGRLSDHERIIGRLQDWLVRHYEAETGR